MDAASVDPLEATGIDALNAAGIDALNAAGVDALDAAGVDALDAAGIDALDAAGIDALETAGVDPPHSLFWLSLTAGWQATKSVIEVAATMRQRIAPGLALKRKVSQSVTGSVDAGIDFATRVTSPVFLRKILLFKCVVL